MFVVVFVVQAVTKPVWLGGERRLAFLRVEDDEMKIDWVVFNLVHFDVIVVNERMNESNNGRNLLT